MVRNVQDWKEREILVEMHGNNGSMDGDPPAAVGNWGSFVWDCRLPLQDIDRKTVPFAWNFHYTKKEPTVYQQPSKPLVTTLQGFQLLCHRFHHIILAEVIDATVYTFIIRTAKADKLMEFYASNDFTVIIQGRWNQKAYETGKVGAWLFVFKTEIEYLKVRKTNSCHDSYEINKANLVKKIDEVRVNNKVAGIAGGSWWVWPWWSSYRNRTQERCEHGARSQLPFQVYWLANQLQSTYGDYQFHTSSGWIVPVLFSYIAQSSWSDLGAFSLWQRKGWKRSILWKAWYLYLGWSYCSYPCFRTRLTLRKPQGQLWFYRRTGWGHRYLATVPFDHQMWLSCKKKKQNFVKRLLCLRLSSVMNELCTISWKRASGGQEEICDTSIEQFL